MKYITSKQFEKSFLKLSKKTKDKAIKQLQIFINNPIDIRLNNHILSGGWSEYRSINITGDIRAIYKPVDKDLVRFIAIGSHSELYS